MLSYIDKGEGTPIVLIHGLGQRKEAWKPQFPLAEKYRLIIPDLRGHGETELEDNITIKTFAQDIVELLDHLNVSKAYICGLSLGGIIAQELYKQEPERVLGLILSNTASYINSWLAYNVVIQAVKHYQHPEFVDAIVERCLYDKKYAEEAKESFLIRSSYIASLGSPLDHNYHPVLTTATVPILLIGSTFDRVTPMVNFSGMYFANMTAKTKVMFRAGHLSNIECREEFNQTIENFIGR